MDFLRRRLHKGAPQFFEVHHQNGGPSYELAALYLAVSLLALIAGPGKLSLDAKLFGRCGLKKG
jgi:uncharacterized membrane protein YphA (DoxX/SURF4 family)